MVERRIAVIVVVSGLSALLVSLLLLGAFLYPGNVASSSSSSQLSGYSRPSTTEYDYSSSVSPVYAQLGYPALTYNGVSQYDPHMPNFTVEYRGTHFGFDIGSVQAAPVMNLTTAVGLTASSTPDLDSSNYTLAAAEFDPGVLVNNTVWAPATWSLWFAQTYDGFWLYGSGSNEATSAYVDMDALSGAVLDSHDFPTYQPILSGNYKLDITATQAIQTVRGLGEFENFSTALTGSGNITSISPRIIKFDPGALPLQQPIDPALDGQSRLCWVISLTHETGFGGEQGAFAVDAETGGLVSGWEQLLFPSSPGVTVSSSMVIPSAQNITISQETFQMNMSAAGLPGSVPVAVPGVFVLKPGSTASIQVSFSSSIGNYVNASLQFSNPSRGLQTLPADGLPPGVSATFSNGTLALPGYSNATRTIFFSVGASAPSGTYLVSLSPVSPELQGAVVPMFFFLTVWDGVGQWPPPPSFA